MYLLKEKTIDMITTSEIVLFEKLLNQQSSMARLKKSSYYKYIQTLSLKAISKLGVNKSIK